MRDCWLVGEILAGDRKAAEAFVSEHSPRVYRLLRWLTGRAEDAEDLTQETFLSAWQGLARYRGEASLATWLQKIAYRQYSQWRLSRRDDGPLPEAEDLPDERAGRALDGVLLRRSLAVLPREQREAFLLHHVQGLSVKEAADVLEVPLGTVLSRLFHARRRLRALMSESEEEACHERTELPAPEPRCRPC